MNKLQHWLDSLGQQHTPDFAESVLYLGQYFPLLHQFANTQQDPIWHAEGDVAIHTHMVLAQLYTLLNSTARHIQGQRRQALILAALLHDIAKPLTTKHKEIRGQQRIVAPRHEELGANYLATRLIELPLSPQVIVSIIGLVGWHQLPKLLVLKNLDYPDYLRLSLDADLELLYWLEQADMKGRECADLELQLELLEQFRMFAEDYGLWGKPDPRSSLLEKVRVKSLASEQIFLDNYAIHQLAHGKINTVEEAIAKNYQPCQQYSQLYIMCGISGSGKSSWIERHLEDFELISLDEIRQQLNGKRECQKSRGQVLQQAKQQLKQALANKRNVVWDATNIRKDFRSAIYALGQDYGALITLVVFQLNSKCLSSNNCNRTFSVTDEVMAKQVEKFEWPWFSETHRTLIIGEQGKTLLERGSFS